MTTIQQAQQELDLWMESYKAENPDGGVLEERILIASNIAEKYGVSLDSLCY